MTLEEAIALQPAWVGIWVQWLSFAAFILPISLLIWKETRLTAVITTIASIAAGAGVFWMFGQMGYVKLLGLPHLIFWVPLCFYLYRQIGKPDLRTWPKRILWVILISISISVVFDAVDVVRYLLGERTPFTA